MANSDVLYKDPIDEVTEQTGMWADFTGNRRAAQKAALELEKVVQQLEKLQEQMVE